MQESEYKENEVQIIDKGGKGRPFVIVCERGTYEPLARELFKNIAVQTRTLLLGVSQITNDNWSQITDRLRSILDREGVRQASFIGFAAASSVVLNLALRELKLVRTLVVIDAATRPHPTLLSRVADRIERFLPLGLPLRSLSAGFDATSFLQRLRCPVLVVTTRRASSFLRSQASLFQERLPTGWWQELSDPPDEEVAALNSAILEFQDVPAKCPQKNAA